MTNISTFRLLVERPTLNNSSLKSCSLEKMKSNQELMAKMLQVLHGYQNNITSLLENPNLLEPHASIGKEEVGF